MGFLGLRAERGGGGLEDCMGGGGFGRGDGGGVGVFLERGFEVWGMEKGVVRGCCHDMISLTSGVLYLIWGDAGGFLRLGCRFGEWCIAWVGSFFT